jgi:hypothetical protein
MVRSELEAAQAEPWVIKLERGNFEPEGEMGYILAIGPSLLLLLIISTEIRFNGFTVIRIEDITKRAAPHTHAEFVEEVLRHRGESVEEAPSVSVADMPSAIQAISKLFPTVAIHREAEDSSICHIGKVVRVDAEHVHLLEIDPDAKWEAEPAHYRISEITRLDFGGGYEDALALIGGEGPELPHLPSVI